MLEVQYRSRTLTLRKKIPLAYKKQRGKYLSINKNNLKNIK